MRAEDSAGAAVGGISPEVHLASIGGDAVAVGVRRLAERTALPCAGAGSHRVREAGIRTGDAQWAFAAVLRGVAGRDGLTTAVLERKAIAVGIAERAIFAALTVEREETYERGQPS